MSHRVRVALATVLSIVWLAPAAAAQESPKDVRLVIGVTADLTTANPFYVNSGSDWSVVTAQYDMLLKFSSEDLAPAPSLAEGCEPSEDSMTWTCTLRDGLAWSDGEPLTSRDVAFSYRFVIDHRIPQYRDEFPFDPVFETPDDHTLIWKAQAPTFAPDMPPWVYVVPEHVWSAYDDADVKTIRAVQNVPSIASGPFVLTSWQRGQGWTMERNERFWGAQPAVDRIDFRLYSNQESMVQALRNGEIDLADGITPSLFEAIEGTSNIGTQQVVSDWWLNLAFNFGGQGPDADPLPALHDLTVRQAIATAIDKQEIAAKVYLGTAAPGDTIIRPASTFWHLDIPPDEEFPYDPGAAAAMLEDAGYVDTDGDGVREDPTTGGPLRLRVPVSTDTEGAVDAGKLIAGYLDAIGIEVQLLPSSDAKMGDYWVRGDFDAYIWYWSGNPDPNYQLSVFTSDQCGAWSDGCWQDPKFDALYQEQRGVMDRDERLAVVQEAQRYAYEQAPSVVLAYPSTLQAYRSDRFTGWTPAPGEHGYLTPMYNYDGLLSVRPVGAGGPTSSPGLSGWIWVAGAGVVLAVVLVLLVRGRRRTWDEA